ncbi:MAG: type II toxin-antitoxin system VapC family toxin [Alphaproteobacteria bacterium]
MIKSADTNIFIHYHDAQSPWHDRAVSYMHSIKDDASFRISSYMLVELYNQLRNVALFRAPYDAQQASDICMAYKNNPRWAYVDYQDKIDDELWKYASQQNFARRRIYDVRMAISLQRDGVKEFATANVKDFKDLGFAHVWNPLEDE